MRILCLTVTLCSVLWCKGPLHSTDQIRSWVEAANDSNCDFPLENLPYGIFRPMESEDPRIGVAIGDKVLDLRGVVDHELIDVDEQLSNALHQQTLNSFLSLGPVAWKSIRNQLVQLLDAKNSVLKESAILRDELLFAMDKVQMLLPTNVGDYTDFYTSVDHARNVGRLFRPDSPLLPNFKQLPLAYNGRASSLQITGTPVVRPKGQILDRSGTPSHGASQRLDYEMELGVYVGVGNRSGDEIAMADVEPHLFGLSLLNDWSARDIQKWEMAPLGPFNGKNFATSLGAWVVTMDALQPYRKPSPQREEGDPVTLPYLQSIDDYALDITVEVYLRSQTMIEEGAVPVLVSRGNFQSMYWTIAQMLVQHASAGCNLRPGDLFGSGTISGHEPHTRGCLLEHLLPDAGPIQLPDGTERRFLEDGDEVTLKAYAWRDGLPRIGFGVCVGQVLSAR